MTNLLALDPGLQGGVAHIRHGKLAQVYKMPVTEGDILELLKALADPPEETTALIEEVSGFAGRPQPGSAMFKFGRNFGFLLGVLQCHCVRIEFVRPARWQREFSLGTASNCESKTAWKNKLKAAAQRLYPNLKVTLNTADALLILEFGRRFHGMFTNQKESTQEPARPNVVPLSKAAS
jgi:crossover junction endodeoxyribonuclease RuvC